ncbi:hypothetical protein NW752_009545 [Fusarium irregulare]|uniref:Uncharacterized protein n=1 Tax=Fusarium irregulare TaxID=2494466 RepID=A0A9W8PFY0_9HYPO|nr:hypothetical protein NW766_011522 [Fusarium irregulare]KAJ4009246.1 hypothetical protein NW752_009545 [Fusarium irregulare]
MKATIATSLLSMQAASVLAVPVSEGNSVLSARQNTDLYKSEDGGFAIVEYGDGKLNYGGRLPSSVLDLIRDECGETACNPSGGLGFTTVVVNSDRGNDVDYTVSVEGSFNLEGQRGSKSQLLDLAKMAFQEVFNAGVAKLQEDVKYITGECPPSQVHGCPGQSSATTDQWESTDHVHVRINDDSGNMKGFLNVGVAMSDSGAGTGICESLSAASAGVGLVNAAAGAGISMLSIGCGLLTG